MRLLKFTIVWYIVLCILIFGAITTPIGAIGETTPTPEGPPPQEGVSSDKFYDAVLVLPNLHTVWMLEDYYAQLVEIRDFELEMTEAIPPGPFVLAIISLNEHSSVTVYQPQEGVFVGVFYSEGYAPSMWVLDTAGFVEFIAGVTEDLSPGPKA